MFPAAPLVVGLLGAALAQAAPLDEPHVGGLGFSGPTSADLAAVYWNPAALALISGGEMTLSLAARYDTANVARAPIDRATGTPGGGETFPNARATGGTRGLTWPPGPGAYFAVGYNFLGRFTLALAAYEPFAERVSFSPAADGSSPTRYHRVDADLRNFALVPALAFRVGRELRIGLAPGFLFSAGRMSFDEDGALDSGAVGTVEDPANAARYQLRSGLSPFDSPPAFTVGGGAYFRHGAWSVGAAYASRPLGKPGGGVNVDADASAIEAPPGSAPVCPPERPTGCVTAQLQYRLPDVITAGVSYQVSPAIEVTAFGRYMTWSQHDRMRIRLTGPATSAVGSAALPDRITLYRGFRNAWDARLRGSVTLRERWRFGAQVRFQTSAVPQEAVSPAAIDGPTLEPALLASARLWRITLSAGYAFAFMLPVTVDRSVFDPTAARACDAAANDLSACGARLAGRDRPTTAGRYTSHGHTVSVTAALRF